MKVLVPLNNEEHIKDYVNCGAGEFYLGFYDEDWVKAFGDYEDINRLTGFKKEANPHSFEEVLQIIRDSKSLNRTIYILFNSTMYSEEQLVWIRRYMEQLKQVGVDGVIVSCLEMVKMAKELGIYCVISTIAGIYNEDIARFYYEFGANRIILPRDLSVTEIEAIVKAVPDADYEVFMMRNGCAFSDAHCLGRHRIELCSTCSSLAHAEKEFILREEDDEQREHVISNHDTYNNQFHTYSCGLCSIYRFVKAGIKAGKIVGRSDQWNNICDDIRMVSENVEIARSCSSEEEYLEKMIMPPNAEEFCKDAMSCYYPEIRF